MLTSRDEISLRRLLVIGCKGIAAYAEHAAGLGREKESIYGFIMEALDSTAGDLSTEEMTNMVMSAGEVAVETMALLDGRVEIATPERSR